MGRGIAEFEEFRAEQYELEQRTSDPVDPAPNEEWLRVDVKPTYVDADGNEQTGVAEYRVAAPDGSVDTAPVAQVGDAMESYVVDKRRAYVDAGGSPTGTGFIPYATQASGEAAYPARRLEHPVEGRLQMHDAIAESAIPDSGVARYEFEQSVTDSWGNFDGIDNTSVGYVSGQIGQYAKELDGTNDYVDTTIGDATILGLNEITVTAWINPDALPSSKIEFLSNSSTDNTVFELYAENGEPHWSINTDLWNLVTINGGGLSTGTHQFVAGVWDNENDRIRLHQGADAEEVSSTTHNGVLTRQGSTEHTVKIGANGDATANYHDGAIDDPRIYTSALTQSQLQNVASGDVI